MKALLVIDMQNDFMPGGPLGVEGAFDLIQPIKELAKTFDYVLATQDWHPENHCSFASAWPVHCVQNTPGAELVAGLPKFARVFRKGTDPAVDSYSAFYDANGKRATGIKEFLDSRGVRNVVLVGVAFDYCVFHSALDARRAGFEVLVRADLCRAVDASRGNLARVKAELEATGVVVQE